MRWTTQETQGTACWVCSFATMDEGDVSCVLNSRCPHPPDHAIAERATGFAPEQLRVIRGRLTTHEPPQPNAAQAPQATGPTNNQAGQPGYRCDTYRAPSLQAGSAAPRPPVREGPNDQDPSPYHSIDNRFDDATLWSAGSIRFDAH